MADLSDVEAALVNEVTSAVYPTGMAAPSVTGKPVRVMRGWPLIGPLAVDLAGGVANISVFAVPNSTHNTTRWAPFGIATPRLPTLSVSVDGNSATFSGYGGPEQLAGVLVANQAFVYESRNGDTPALVAAMLAETVRGSRACWLSGTTISIPGAATITARVVAGGTTLTEWARQRQGFRVSAWCPDPLTRDTLCRAISSSLSSITFMTLGDGTGGRLRYRSTESFDDDQDAQQYRRDLVYDVEYGTTVEAIVPSMLFGDLICNGASTLG